MSDEHQLPYVFGGGNINQVFPKMIQTINAEGETVGPHGRPTLELLDVVTRLNRPRERLLTVPGRGLNPFFNLAETVWILQGRSDADWICQFNGQLRKVLDPGGTHFHGAYGKRIRRWGECWKTETWGMDQLLDCFWKLYQSQDTRQAVIVLYNPDLDNAQHPSLDIPCNDMIFFKIRNGRLWMSVMNRSNDAILGLTSTNVIQFSTIQEVLASWLGVEVGPYTHFSHSLHMYQTNPFTGAEASGTYKEPVDIYAFVDPTPMKKVTPDETRDMLNTIVDSFDKNLEAPRVSCPYWQSVSYALQAWRYVKRTEYAAAYTILGAMAAKDWQIECFRFVWAKENKPPFVWTKGDKPSAMQKKRVINDYAGIFPDEAVRAYIRGSA